MLGVDLTLVANVATPEYRLVAERAVRKNYGLQTSSSGVPRHICVGGSRTRIPCRAESTIARRKTRQASRRQGLR